MILQLINEKEKEVGPRENFVNYKWEQKKKEICAYALPYLVWEY